MGDEFEIVTRSSVTGAFAAQSLQARGNWEVDTSSGNSVVLRILL